MSPVPPYKTVSAEAAISSEIPNQSTSSSSERAMLYLSFTNGPLPSTIAFAFIPSFLSASVSICPCVSTVIPGIAGNESIRFPLAS